MDRLRCRFVVVVAVVYCLGCGSRGDGLSTSDRESIRRAFDTYFGAANAANASQWARLYTSDAVMMPPGTPAVEGRATIEAWLTRLPRIQAARGEAVEIAGQGSAAYVRGSYTMEVVIPGVPQPIGQAGKLLQIYTKQSDGAWLLARDIWNANAP